MSSIPIFGATSWLRPLLDALPTWEFRKKRMAQVKKRYAKDPEKFKAQYRVYLREYRQRKKQGLIHGD